MKKKCFAKLKEYLLLLFVTVSFWSLFYPNFSFTSDVCKIYRVDEQLVDTEVDFEDEKITIEDLKKGNVKVKSRVWEWIQKWIK